MEQNVTWLLIADASQAKLYSIKKAKFLQENHPRHLNLIGHFSHDASRKKAEDLVSDKMGSYGLGSFNATDPRKNEANQFAHELIGHLEIGRKEAHFRDLILIAPPQFMGLLHTHMPHLMQKMVSQKIEKDYTHFTDTDLVNNLVRHF